MKILSITVWAIIACSIFAVSLGTGVGYYLTNTSGEQARFPSDHGTNVGEQPPQNALADDTRFSDSFSAISLGQLISDDPHSDKQWALSRIQAPELWQVITEDRDILIAILDTGIDKNHEDLAGTVVAEVNFTDSPSPSDLHGHGTHIAGIISAATNNGKGIVGVAPGSRLMNVKVADDEGKCQASVIAKGIVWAVENGAEIINISLELREPSTDLEDAVKYAWSRGALIIAAAGNVGNSMPIYPACYQNTIAVAASKVDDTLAPLSNYGEWVDVASPGFNIYSTLPDDSYGYKSGTSFAAAHVSGMATMIFSIATDTNGNGRLNDEVRAAIEAGCCNMEGDYVAKGRIDAVKSLAEIGYSP